MSEPRPLGAIVLAAGLGTRMRSSRAKVLHEISGHPLVHYPLRALRPLGPTRTIVVVGHQAEAVRRAAQQAGLPGVGTALQAEQHGTGHAVQCAAPAFDGFDGDVVILYGDVPFIRTETLQRLVEAHRGANATLSLLTVWFDDPTGYGRIVRDEAGRVQRIVEQRDASPVERAIKEINPGFYCVRASVLALLEQLRTDNAQGELYLTDLVALVAARGERIETVTIERADEVAGINTRMELARMEATLRHETVERWMAEGVTFIDPATAYVDLDVTIGRDTVIGPNVVLRGATVIGSGCRLDGTNHVTDTRIGDDARLGFGCVTRGGTIAGGAQVAPFSRIGTAVRASARSKPPAAGKTPAAKKPARKAAGSKVRTAATKAVRRKR